MSEVGFGCMITSDERGRARRRPGRHLFDTARNYQAGNNERMVGAALKRRRNDLVLSTKASARTKSEALAQLDESLRQLGTNRVDIWYLHAVKSPAELSDELLDAQREARRQGKARFVGVSLHAGHAEVIPAAIDRPPDVVQVTYNFTMSATTR